LFVPPAGPGVPAPGADEAWDAATRECRDLTGFAPTLRLGGRIAGARVPGLTVLGAVTAGGGIRLQATGAGRTLFELAGTNDRATFYWREDNKAATARAEELVEALVGLKIGADALLPILTGCVTREAAAPAGRRHDRLTEISAGSSRVFLEQHRSVWRVRYAEVRGLAVEYVWGAAAFPREVRIAAQRGTPSEVLLTLRIDDDPIVNPVLGPETFALKVPATAAPMTLDEIRDLLRRR
jgi:hypothetical protein